MADVSVIVASPEEASNGNAEYHLRKIFVKLGISSRAELKTALADLDWSAPGVTPVGRTRHATGDPPGRDALRAPAALPL